MSVNPMIHDILDAPPVPLSTQRVTPADQPKIPAKILIVDDREDKLTALESVLAPMNETVVLAKSGRDALREVLHHEFAVILMDVFMPNMDGFETATMIRQRAQCAHTPIIFITSVHNTDDLTARGYSLGAVDYIFSPIIPDVLRTKVNVFLDVYRKTKIIAEQAQHIEKLRTAPTSVAQVQQQLESQTRTNPFFMLSTQMLAVIDATGVFRCVNPAWEHYLGFIEDELKEKSILTLVHDDDWQTTSKALLDVEKRRPITFDARHRRKDGSYCKLSWTILPFTGSDHCYVFAREIGAANGAKKIHVGFSRS